MSYKHQTRFYRIPVLGYGDAITEEEEMRQMSIIDNLLYASTFRASKCILEEGDYSIKKSSGNYVLEIKKPDDGEYSLLGIINYRLFMSDATITSREMQGGYIWYVYVKYTSYLENEVDKFVLETDLKKQEDDCFLLVAEVDLTDENNIKINVDTDKIYAKNILAHTADHTNPHGRKLIQDELYLQNNRVYTPIYGKMTVFINQENKYVCPENFVPVFATIYPENPNMGTIAWKIYNNNVLIWVSGLSSGDVNIKVEGYYK